MATTLQTKLTDPPPDGQKTTGPKVLSSDMQIATTTSKKLPKADKLPPLTKSATIITAMSGTAGATLGEICSITTWQPHSARAFLSGLRKKGHNILKTSRDGATCYHIAPEKIGDRS